MNTLRTYAVGLVSTVWTATRMLLSAALRSPRFPEMAQEAPRGWAATILRAARVKVEVEGLEHLVGSGPAVLVANHESWFDVFAMVAHLPVNYRFVGKIELTRIPFFGPAWVSAGHIAIDRSDRDRAIESLQRAGETLRREGAVVVMFPEGTRSRDGKLLPFKKGAFVLALQTGVPVIPVGISGSRPIMPKGAWRVRPGTIRIRIGPPIPPGAKGEKGRDALLREAREKVEGLRKTLPERT